MVFEAHKALNAFADSTALHEILCHLSTHHVLTLYKKGQADHQWILVSTSCYAVLYIAQLVYGQMQGTRVQPAFSTHLF